MEAAPVWSLSLAQSSLVVSVARDGVPAIDYWGPALAKQPAAAHALLTERAVPHGGFDRWEPLSCLPGSQGDFSGQPALALRDEMGAVDPHWSLTAVDATPEALRFILDDNLSAARAQLDFDADHASDTVLVALTLENRGVRRLWLDRCAVSIAVPHTHAHYLAFDGGWCREFQAIQGRLDAGLYLRESRTGRTSHHDVPAVVISDQMLTDETGQGLAVHLAWSGDHWLAFERLRDGRRQVLAGARLEPGEIALMPGQVYRAPPVVVTSLQHGLNGLRERSQAFVRSRIIHPQSAPPPVQLNTWEAIYFDHHLDDLKTLADRAASLGVERFVLDDGWFGRRTNDRRGLGDWTPRTSVYPDGLLPLADHVRAKGMAFGLWVEPEMVNRDSALFEAHPDWILGEVDQALGRHQYCLDLSRHEVVDHLRAVLSTLIRELTPSILKWDMNRDRIIPRTQGRPSAHAQTQALYRLMDDLRAAFPALQIETCASGGGRVDLGILRRTDRVWMSDNHDPDSRARIFEGFSLFFPRSWRGITSVHRRAI